VRLDVELGLCRICRDLVSQFVLKPHLHLSHLVVFRQPP
jgi:hypothetical protein